MELDTQVFNLPLEDGKRYMARIVGVLNMGRRKQPSFDGSPQIVAPAITLAFELLDEDTFVDKVTPRILIKCMRLSVHPKSQLYRTAMKVNPDTISMHLEYPDDSEEPVEVHEIDVAALTYGLVELEVIESRRHSGVFMIGKIHEADSLAKALYTDAPVSTPYVYDAVTDNLIAGSLRDIPEKFLKHIKETMLP